jgi:hypothetical protein
MNVPTLIAKPHSSNYHGWQYSEISSAPYLTGSTGKLWNNMRDLEAILKNFDTFKFAPREWVVENMSDSVTSAKLICNINV